MSSFSDSKVATAPLEYPSPSTFIIRTLMESYATQQAYNGVLQITLSRFRQLMKDLNIFDTNKVNPGDVNVAYSAAINHHVFSFGTHGLHGARKGTLQQIEDVLWEPLKWPKHSSEYGHTMASFDDDAQSQSTSTTAPTNPSHISGGGGALHHDRTMQPSQFRAALVDIATVYYADLIVKINKKHINLLHMSDEERQASSEAAFEVLYNTKILPHVTKYLNFNNDDIDRFDYVTTLLIANPVTSIYKKELSALTQLHDRYAESERSKKSWATKHGNSTKAGAGNRANLKILTFKELTTLLQDFGVVPHFIKNSQVYHLFRQFTRRTLAEVDGSHGNEEGEVVLGAEGGGLNKQLFRLSADNKGRNWRSVSLPGLEGNQEETHMEIFRPDFLNFSQFAEMMGHIAVAAFSAKTTEERLIMMWKWLDQSGINREKNPNKMKSSGGRHHVPIRFSSRSDFK